jgi:hypothetical protein
MKKGTSILLLGVLLSAAGFSGFYYIGTASSRATMRETQPELAWLKQEFKLNDTEFARISQMHAAYLPECAERCRHIEEQNQKLQALLAQSTNVTPEIQSLLAERAKTRAECEAEMMKHFLKVSQTMPPEQGRRYLAWVEKQTILHGQAMEEHHHQQHAGHTSEKQPM